MARWTYIHTQPVWLACLCVCVVVGGGGVVPCECAVRSIAVTPTGLPTDKIPGAAINCCSNAGEEEQPFFQSKLMKHISR
jgi:hypothetical protein